LAFFNGPENRAIIQKIKALSLPVKQEVIFGEEASTENLILNDPGGLGFFILITKRSRQKLRLPAIIYLFL